MPTYPLTNFEIQKYYRNQPRFNGIYSRDKNRKTNIFRIQAYDSKMCGCFYIWFIDFMLAGKTLTDFTYLFRPNNFKKMMT